MKKDLHGVMLRDNLPHNASFWQVHVGLSDVVLLKYSKQIPKFHKFNFDDIITFGLYAG